MLYPETLLFAMGGAIGVAITFMLMMRYCDAQVADVKRELKTARAGAQEIINGYRDERDEYQDRFFRYLRVIQTQNALLALHGYAEVEIEADMAQGPVLPPLTMKKA